MRDLGREAIRARLMVGEAMDCFERFIMGVSHPDADDNVSPDLDPAGTGWLDIAAARDVNYGTVFEVSDNVRFEPGSATELPKLWLDADPDDEEHTDPELRTPNGTRVGPPLADITRIPGLIQPALDTFE